MRELFFNLTWLIPLFPLLAFALIVLWANPNRKLSTWLAWIGMGLSWILGWAIFFLSWGDTHHLTPPEGNHPVPLWTLPAGTEDAVLKIGFQVDTLTALMLFMVPFVCLMIFIYSKGYMGFGTDQVDPRYSRFFAYISLFGCGMLGLVVADNLLALFIFWEIMGLCSYLLIGFWYEKSYPDPKRITPKEAGLKAFLTTRVGDVIMLLGLLLLYSQVGSLTFKDIFNHETLEMLVHETVALPLFGSVPVATLAAILVFGGAVGKSAQFPLHVWLPDAMEGPTPVSALIHAATMVSAGVYLVARSFPLFVAVPGGTQLAVVAFIGAFTALFASTIAVAQNDIKRVLAYSTISQLGYMIAALGIGAYVAAVFHLITHSFFKALLFLSSGSVIHGVEHGHHHVAHGHPAHEEEYFDANDMLNMGGLLSRMPRTGWSFIIGALALTGIVPWAGFWSKDEILADAWHAFQHGGHFGVSENWGFFVWLLLTVAAALTAFYTGRQIFLTFAGKPRTEAAGHAPESVASMTWPLIILAIFATVLGLFGMPWGNLNQYYALIGHEAEIMGHPIEHGAFNPLVALISLGVAGAGWAIAWLIYGRKPLSAGQVDPLKRWLGPVHTLLENKYYFDELYQLIFIRPVRWLADVFAKFDYDWVINRIVNLVGKVTVFVSDRWGEFDLLIVDGVVNLVGRAGASISTGLDVLDLGIVDGIVNWIGDLIKAGGRFLRPIQTGRVQNYLLVAIVTAIALLGLYLILPSP
jgi:NADH-quinone oxidoreductase subunit L